MKDVSANQLALIAGVSSAMIGVVAAIVASDGKETNALVESFPDPADYVEHPNDIGGLKAFLLAASKRCVELLETSSKSQDLPK